MDANTLNAVAAFLASQGITPTKELVFSACCKALMEAGMSAPEALNFVCGDGSFDRLVDSLFTAFNA